MYLTEASTCIRVSKDQLDNFVRATERGIEFSERFGQFVRQRAELELEHAKGLRKLVKAFQPKKKGDADVEFTYFSLFAALQTATATEAEKHESIAEKLNEEVAADVAAVVADLRQKKRKLISEADAFEKKLQASLGELERGKKQYERAFKQSCVAAENYQKADADLNLSRAELERTKNVMITKRQSCEEFKSDYAKRLSTANAVQRHHYATHVPALFQTLREVDGARVARFAAAVGAAARVQLAALPGIKAAMEAALGGVDSVDPIADWNVLSRRSRNGFEPPDDIPFEELGLEGGGRGGGGKGGGGVKKGSEKKARRNTLMNIFRSNRSSTSDLSSRSGGASDADRSRGSRSDGSGASGGGGGPCDGASVVTNGDASHEDENEEGGVSYDVTDSGHGGDEGADDTFNDDDDDDDDGVEYEQINHRPDGERFVPHRPAPQPPGRSPDLPSHHLRQNALPPNVTPRHLNHASASAARLASRDGNASSKPAPPPRIPAHAIGAVETRAGFAGTADRPLSSPSSSPSSPTTPSHNDHPLLHRPSLDSSLPLPVLCACRALYDFTSINEETIDLREGEELNIVELDEGDGWTRVRRVGVAGTVDEALEEGYAPTSYLEMDV